MALKQIGYFAFERGTMDCVCKGLNLIVMNNPKEMEKFVRISYKIKHFELKKVYSEEMIKGLKMGGHYLLSNQSYKEFTEQCISQYPEIFPPHRLIVIEPVDGVAFIQVSWEKTSFNTPNK